MKKLCITIEVDLDREDNIQPVLDLINGTLMEHPYLNSSLADMKGKLNDALYKRERIPFLVTEVKIAK